MASIKLQNVYKYYKGKREVVEAVKNLNLEINNKEIVALLGPSGCGKTSTLRMIAGIESISNGNLLINDKVVNDLTPAERNVALAFEDYALYFHLKVRENIGLCLDAKRLGQGEIAKRVIEISCLLGIDDILDKRPNELSGGQQQRVSLARALVREPSIFLLDEPISHVEVERRFQILAKIKEIHYETGTTMLYITHNQLEAIMVGERIAVMNVAELQQIGTRADIVDNPANVFVASFVGQPPINLIHCEVIIEDRKLILKDCNSELRFTPKKDMASAIKANRLKRVIVGIRPQNLFLHRTSQNKMGLRGTVDIVEFLGENSHFVVKNNNTSLSVVSGENINFQKNDNINLHYDAAKLHIFNPETEKVVNV